MIGGVRYIHPRAEINLPLRRKIKVNHRKDLLRLLRSRVEVRDRPKSSIIFEATGDLLGEIKTEFHIRRKFPSPPCVHTMQRPVKRKIKREVPPPQLLVDDRTKLIAPAVLRKLPPLIPNFLRDAQTNRQVPRFRSSDARTNVIAHPIPAT